MEIAIAIVALLVPVVLCVPKLARAFPVAFRNAETGFRYFGHYGPAFALGVLLGHIGGGTQEKYPMLAQFFCAFAGLGLFLWGAGRALQLVNNYNANRPGDTKGD